MRELDLASISAWHAGVLDSPGHTMRARYLVATFDFGATAWLCEEASGASKTTRLNRLASACVLRFGVECTLGRMAHQHDLLSSKHMPAQIARNSIVLESACNGMMSDCDACVLRFELDAHCIEETGTSTRFAQQKATGLMLRTDCGGKCMKIANHSCCTTIYLACPLDNLIP